MSNKKDQLKALFKPIIKECIRDLLLEEGVLSTMISEINKANRSPSAVLVDQKSANTPKQETIVKNKAKIEESKRKIYAALGSDNYASIFENVEPLSNFEAGQTSTPAHDPLSGHAPNDPGVDISSIPGMGAWKTLATDKKR